MSLIKEHFENIQWCIDKHRNVSHFYDEYLPYEFHLRMVVQVFKDFKHLVAPIESFNIIEMACWGHDLIEDTRTSYNDCKEVLGENIADIIYALTNEKGKNRSERANDAYYSGIKQTEGAVFVKLCDRIANVQYSKLTKSRMFEMYRKENRLFVSKMSDERFITMTDYLDGLFYYYKS